MSKVSRRQSSKLDEVHGGFEPSCNFWKMDDLLNVWWNLEDLDNLLNNCSFMPDLDDPEEDFWSDLEEPFPPCLDEVLLSGLDEYFPSYLSVDLAPDLLAPCLVVLAPDWVVPVPG